MKVSIILPYYEQPVKGCVESIKQQTYKDVELIKISEKELGVTERKGAGFMRNEGAKRATGDVLFFLDADAVLLPDTISEAVQIIEGTKADAVSSLPLAPNKTETNLLNYLIGLEYEERIRAMGEGWADVAATTGFAIRRDVFDEVKGFVTEFPRGVGEDWVLSARLVEGGYKIWHSNKVKLYHFVAQTLKKYLIKQAWHAGYRVIHYKRYRKVKDSYTTFLPSTIFLCNIPLTMRLLKQKNDLALLLLPPLSIARSIVWITAAILVWLGIFRLQAS